MYVSPLYRASLAYALSRAENKDEQVFILSALHDLLPLNKPISTYEKTLGNMSRAKVADWGRTVGEKLLRLFHIEDTHFVFLAGEKYVSPLRKYLKHYSEPLKGISSIGGRTRWLKEHRLSDDRDSFDSIFNNHKTPGIFQEVIKVSDGQPLPNPIMATRAAPTKKDFTDSLQKMKLTARESGAPSITITSGELHRLVGGYPGPNHRMPMCCEVMYAAMRKGDEIIYKPPKGKGASLKITYRLGHSPGEESDPSVGLSTPAESTRNNAMTSVWPRELRSIEKLQLVPKDKPGWYRWWAPISALEQLLDSSHLTHKYMKELLPHLRRRDYEQDHYFFIYVGIAIKESIRDRLNWHVNQHHTENAVRNGILSTFRKTVSSLVAGDQYDEDATNKLIDQLMIEYCAMDYPIKSEAAKIIIEQIEHDELERYILPLNIMGNRQAMLKSFSKDLKKARKRSNSHRQ